MPLFRTLKLASFFPAFQPLTKFISESIKNIICFAVIFNCVQLKATTGIGILLRRSNIYLNNFQGKHHEYVGHSRKLFENYDKIRPTVGNMTDHIDNPMRTIKFMDLHKAQYLNEN